VQLVYATTNPGKFSEVAKFFSAHSLTIHSPTEYGVELEVPETGVTLEENAILKAEAFRDALPADCIVIGDDTGVEIDALGGEPGIRVRRWAGRKMTDQEIIDYCIKRMENVPIHGRFAQFRTVLAVSSKGQKTKIFDGILAGHIVEEPTPLKIEGFPFESLFFSKEYDLMLGDIHELSIENKIEKKIFTHRERAINSSLVYLKSII
jgi:XTP/dITP diphosphohydrolase